MILHLKLDPEQYKELLAEGCDGLPEEVQRKLGPRELVRLAANRRLKVESAA